MPDKDNIPNGPFSSVPPRREPEPCAHDSTRIDGTLDDCCLKCGAAGWWHDGHAHFEVHPSGKPLMILACPTEAARVRRLCEGIVHLDKTPAYGYDKGRAGYVDRDGNPPDSGRWFTPREMAQNMLRALDAGTPASSRNEASR